MIEIKTKINGKHTEKVQRVVPGEMGWEWSQGAGISTQRVNVAEEYPRPVGLSCRILVMLACDS